MRVQIVRSETPFNAEPPLSRLRSNFVTPLSDFYVRCHGDVPFLSEHTHTLAVQGRVGEPLKLSITELRSRFTPRNVMALMQCAGNRRADLHQLRPVTIGNAAWTGVSLADVLRAAEADLDPALHVAFESADTVNGQPYGVSIPMTKALCPDVLLAFEMNGELLGPEQGFHCASSCPVLPWCAVRNGWITVQDTPSGNPMQQTDYKLFPPHVTSASVDWAMGITINEMPLNAAICEPADGAEVPAGPLTVRGYAAATGRTIERVDLIPTAVFGGTRRSWNGGQTRPGVGLSGRRRSICRLGITNSPFVPGIRLDRRNPPWPRTPGTSKATSPPLGTEYA